MWEIKSDESLNRMKKLTLPRSKRELSLPACFELGHQLFSLPLDSSETLALPGCQACWLLDGISLGPARTTPWALLGLQLIDSPCKPWDLHNCLSQILILNLSTHTHAHTHMHSIGSVYLKNSHISMFTLWLNLSSNLSFTT